MNRYDIQQVATGGISHSYIASAPMDPQPEWGTQAYTIQNPVLDASGSPVLGSDGTPTFTITQVPATYTVVITNLTGTSQDPAWICLRNDRDQRLSACDWTMSSDSPLDATAHAAWVTYRQALRDLPKNTADPTNPTWPTPPATGTHA